MLTDSRKITNDLVIYSVLISDYEKLDFKNDALAGVRANYFNSGKTPQRDKTEITFDNKIYSLSYYMGNNGPFSWKITRNSYPYQTVKKATGGVYCVIFYGDNGIINKRQYFDESHNWIRTEYYDYYHENVLKAVLSPKNICGILVLKLERISSEEKREAVILYPSTDMPTDKCCGVMYSNSGMIWYDESFKPEDMPEENTVKEKKPESGFNFNNESFSGVDITIGNINLSEADYLDENNLPEITEEEPITDKDTEEKVDTETQYSAYDKIARILEEAHKTNKDLFGEVINQTSNEAENEEISESEEAIYEESIEQPDEAEIIDVNSISDENDTAESDDIFVEDFEIKDDTAEEITEVNSEETSESVMISKFEEDHNDDLFEEMKNPPCDVVIHTKTGRYSYYGDVDDNNCRTGRGRTVTPDGKTSYDGEYQNDKRNGFGVCYYKEGNINYSGYWKNGDREGCGTGYRLSDGTMHAGKWSNNTPNGFGARFDNNGNFLDLCNYVDGKRNGTGVSIDENGNVTIRKWKDGEIISEITIRN